VENCSKERFIPPVFVSSNLDIGDKINAEYIEKYSNLITCL